MTREEQVKSFKEFTTRQSEILFRKGADYAISTDVLSNFKYVGNICGVSPEINCLNLIATKVARLGVLLNGKEPNNESIGDSVIDLANYAILLNMLLEDA